MSELGLALNLMHDDHNDPMIRLVLVLKEEELSNLDVKHYNLDINNAVWLRNNLSDLLKKGGGGWQ